MSVVWVDKALDRLADIYVRATPADRDEIARCVLRINAQLAADPSNLGESRGDGSRAWFTHPLMVIFRPVPGGGVVVRHVARLRGRIGDP